MLDTLLQLDYVLFELINGTWYNEFFDRLMPILRNKQTWIPFYLFMVLFFFGRFHWKKASLVVLFSILTIGISDTLSSRIVKKTIERSRPCHEKTEIPHNTRLLIHCGSGYSFTSSHATNHFALAGFWLLVLGGYARITAILLLFWAGIISYAQIYVGVHYPIDIIGGCLLGLLSAHLMAYLLNIIFKQYDRVFA